MDRNRGIYIFLFLLLLLFLGLSTYHLYSNGVIFKPKEVLEEEPIEQEIQFKTKKGLEFELTNPLPNSELGCEFILSGKMPNGWFFEASFRYSIVVNDKEILSGLVQTEDDYTITKMPFFSTNIICNEECYGESEIVLRNDNPSGLLENEDEYRIPVKFVETCSTPEEISET